MKTTPKFNTPQTARTGLTVLAAAIVMALAGCSGSGHLNTSGSGGGSTPTGPGGGGGVHQDARLFWLQTNLKIPSR